MSALALVGFSLIHQFTKFAMLGAEWVMWLLIFLSVLSVALMLERAVLYRKMDDDLEKLGGFYTQLEYGVMFPLGGLGYLPGEEQEFVDAGNPVDLSTAQTVRWYLGILY